MSTRPIVLFDSDCSFCTRSAQLLNTRWFRSKVTLEPLQTADLDAYGLKEQDVLDLMHVVLPDGSATIGHRAWASILEVSRQPWPIVGRLLTAPGIDQLAAAVYGWIAANREKMPGGTAACAVDGRPQASGA